MCSRYTSANEAESARAMRAKLKLQDGVAFKPIIYPGYQAPVVLEVDGARNLESRFWGFITRFPGKKDPEKLVEKIMQNAVSETVNEKRTFSSAWKKRQRCLIPVQAFFEPKDKTFVPIRLENKGLLGIAGIYSEVTYKAQKLDAFTMLTCAPNGFIQPFHDRMPVILNEADWDRWLAANTTPAEASRMCRPFAGVLEFS